jgi:RNA-directed DNA polymerase
MSARQEAVAQGLATALLAGPWTAPEMAERVRAALGRRTAPRWVGALVTQVLSAYRDRPADRPRELAAFVQRQPAWGRAWRAKTKPRVVHWQPTPTVIVRRPWPIAQLDDVGALARLFSIDSGELAWFADVRSMERRVGEPLRHYRWRMLPKGRGGVRLVAAPKPRLKEIQRRLLRHVLDPIPLHPSAHGSVAGRSVRTAVAPHSGATVVIRADIESFYASIAAGRVWGVLRNAGLPEAVAHSITGLVTTVVPLSVARGRPRSGDIEADQRDSIRWATPHLPQGAPTSPALANLVAFSLDRRLAGLAARFGAQYTRYADDLTFSGGPSLRASRGRFVSLVGDIVVDEGFRLNDRKTVVLGAAGRQQVLGAVINDHPTLPRRERDNLRALLHNCIVDGWRSQVRGQPDFAAYLLGRISWAGSLDPVFGARLRAAFDTIDWS